MIKASISNNSNKKQMTPNPKKKKKTQKQNSPMYVDGSVKISNSA